MDAWTENIYSIFRDKLLLLGEHVQAEETGKKKSPKELANMKKAYDTASAFTTIMNNTLDKCVPYEDFTEMNQDMLRQVNLTIEKIQQMMVMNPHQRVVVLVRTRHLLQKRNKN
jgi:hypothetical protein